MSSGRLNSLSLKYKSYSPSGCKDKEIRKFELVAKIQYKIYKMLWEFLYKILQSMISDFRSEYEHI